MVTTDILVIGAGATGLMAARELCKAGKKVTILEARDRAGGRIQTVHDPAFDLPIELGAEFVHGDLELTLRLMREAGIEYYPVRGRLWRSMNGRLEKQEDFLVDEKELLKRLKALEKDMSVHEFLYTYFHDERYTELRQSLTSFVEGYDAADIKHASCFSLLEELLGGDSSEQYRVKGGYVKLTDYLVSECKKAGCTIELSTVVSAINWRAGEVTVTTNDNRTFTSSKVIITLPLSILQSTPDERAYVDIDPFPPEKRYAINSLGITGVIKVVLQFNNAFWKNSQENIGFVFSNAPIPTWWTQLPEENGMISGWLAGPSALRWKDLSDKEILERALHSLSKIFSIEINALQSQLTSHYIANWTAEDFTLGAYGYERVESKHAKQVMNTPMDNTVFFAGEALNEGPDHGTVEGALRSAEYVVSQILK